MAHNATTTSHAVRLAPAANPADQVITLVWRQTAQGPIQVDPVSWSHWDPRDK